MTDSHRCIADRDCRRTEIIDGRRAGALNEKPDTLCPVCTTHITSAIRQLPRDWAELGAALGERAASTGQRIRSTPAPAIPISTRKDALMAEIVDMADRAAAIVSDRLHTGQPATYHGRGYPERQERALRASVAIVGPNIDLLASAPDQPAMIWSKPRRCDNHTRMIRTAETILEIVKPGSDPEHDAKNQLRRAYAGAGSCDDCNGWGTWGQERQLTSMTGLDIALQLVELHNQTRAELGKTKLRHSYEMPCPNCGAEVGRDDGTTTVDCKNCESSWTEREYKFLVGLITRERLDMEIRQYLLDEAYARLDDVTRRLNMLTEQELALPGSGQIIADAMRAALGDHQPPDKRAIGTTRQAAEERQIGEDNDWNSEWRNPTAYQRPKLKRDKTTRVPAPPLHPSLTSALVDTNYDPDDVRNRDTPCHDCNLIHAGKCG